ncbi:MAG: FliG C-terminal domain-containing protein [bacterium]
MRIRILAALFCFFLIVLPGNAFAKQGSDIETKIAIEKNLEERLRRILTEITGTDKLIIVINVQLISSSSEDEEEPAVVLPGVPLQEKLGLGLASLDLGDTAKNIKKLTAQIIVDNGLPESMVNIIREVSTSVLGLEAARGDALIIKKMNFRENPFKWSDIIYPPHLWGLLFSGLSVILIAVLFVFGTRVFPRAAGIISETLESSLKKSETAPAFSSPVSASAPAAGGGAGGGEREGVKKHFSFVNEENTDKLLFLLKKEKPENIAVLINYAPQVADKILSGLEPSQAREALLKLAQTRTLPPDEVLKWEEHLRQKMDFMVGGKEVVKEILEGLGDEEMDSYLDFIAQSDSLFADELRSAVFRAGSLADMASEDILLLSRSFTPAAFANVLRTLDESVRNGILEKLPEGIATRLKEEIELGASPGPVRLREDKKALARVADKLRKDGLLVTPQADEAAPPREKRG